MSTLKNSSDLRGDRYNKAVVEEDQIVEHAVWTYVTSAPPAELEAVEGEGEMQSTWPDEGDAEFARQCFMFPFRFNGFLGGKVERKILIQCNSTGNLEWKRAGTSY